MSNNGWKWWQDAWYETEGARVELFAVALVSLVILAVFHKIPLLSFFLVHASLPFIQLGYFEFARNWKEKRSKDFNSLLILYKDLELLKRLLPLAIVGVAFGFAYVVCDWLANHALAFGALRFVFMALEMILFLFAVPLMAYSAKTPGEAFNASFYLVKEHLADLAVFYGLGFLFGLAGIATVGIGFLFLLPLSVYAPYLLYSRLTRSVKD